MGATRDVFRIALTAAVLTLGVPALAGAPAAEGPAPYFEMDGHGWWLSAPSVERFGTATVQFNLDNTTRHPDSDSEIETWGGGFDMRMGMGVPFGLLPGWQLEFGVSYNELDEHSSSRTRLTNLRPPGSGPPTPGEAENLMPVSIGGSPTFLFLAGEGQRVLSRFDADIQLYELRLQLAKPIDFIPGVNETVRFGIMGGELDQDYSIQQDIRGSGIIILPFGPPLFPRGNAYNEMNEQAESWFFGGVFGIGLDAKLLDRISAFLEIEMALMAHGSHLDAQQRVVGTAFTGPPCDDPSCELSFSVTDEEDHFNFRPRVEMGFDYDLGWAVVGLTSAFTYWTYAPEVVNPRRPRFTNTFIQNGNARARLSSGDMMAAELGMRLVIPFGRD